MVFTFKSEHFLPIGIDQAWDFFSSAGNLAAITPPEMDFKILTDLDEREVYEGMLIDYTVKPLFGIPVRWQTEIYKVNKPAYFSDRQRKGPYRIWEHTHSFIEKENGVLMKDEVRYQLPFGIIGRIAHAMIIKKKIESIFSFREKALNKIFINT